MNEQPRLKKIIKFTVMLIISAVALFPPGGCLQNTASNHVSPQQTSKSTRSSRIKERLFFLENKRIGVCDLEGQTVRNLFSVKGEIYPEDFIAYYPQEAKFIYEAINDGVKELHERSIKGRDTKIDRNIDKVFPHNSKGSVLYTKVIDAYENELYVYEDKMTPKPLNIFNVSNLVSNEESNSEFCYTASLSTNGRTNNARNKMYLGSISAEKHSLIVDPPTNTWLQPISLSNRFVVFTQGETAVGGNISVYTFDRKTKQTYLLAKNAILIDVAKQKNSVLVGFELSGKDVRRLELWELAMDNSVKKHLCDIQVLAGEPINAKFLLDGRGIVFMAGSNREIWLYEHKTRKARSIFKASKGLVSEIVLSNTDKKSLFYILNRNTNGRMLGEDTLRRINMETGQRSIIYKASAFQGKAVIRIISQQNCSSGH